MNTKATLSLVPWKIYLTVTAETLLAFFLATFSLAMYFVHRPNNWVLPFILMVLLFMFVVGACIRRVFDKLPLSAVMLIIPIAPFLALVMVVSLIPILQYLH